MPMGTPSSQHKEREETQPPQLKLCLPLSSTFRRVQYNVMVISNSVFCAGSPCFLEDRKIAMEDLIEKKEAIQEKTGKKNGGKIETFGDLIEDKYRESSSSSDFHSSETTAHEERSPSSTEESSSSPLIGWRFQEMPTPSSINSHKIDDGGKKHLNDKKFQKKAALPEIEMMKERFAKLLLGEDMSGCGNGVSTALAVSNAITNLCATLFGQIWRLEPVPREKKAMWRREMEWLLSVSDHIVELAPTWQTFPDGSKLEVMTCRPRSDLYVNLPALRKLDNMLLEILDSFVDTDFWYVDEGLQAPEADGSFSFRTALQRQEEKWWLPVPRVPTCGLDDDSRKKLQHKRDCTNQILKAAMAINSITLADMDIPESYLESLPKNARVSLGDIIYQYISTDQFSPECLLECLDLSSEHQAIEIANRVEASIYIWRKRTNAKPASNTTRYSSRSSWEMVRDLMLDTDKTELLAEKAESLLLSLKKRFPGLPQTALDTSKIQHNKDVGKSILESYSRVLESLAYNIVARIEDVLYVDDLTKHSDQLSRLSKAGVVTHKPISVPYSTPVPSSPYKSGFTTPSFSPAQVTKRSSFSSTNADQLPQHGGGAKKVLTDYLNIDKKGKEHLSPIEKVAPTSKTGEEDPAFGTDLESSGCTEEALSRKISDQAWELVK